MRIPLTGFPAGAARFLLLLCVVLVAVFSASAQELPAAGNDNAGNGVYSAYNDYPEENGVIEDIADAEEAEEPHPEAAYLEMEIRTSSLMELAAWARELGISDGGTREELAARLRTHYRLPSPLGADFVEQRVITIESAVTTEYFTLEVVNEDYARFRGGVMISLRDGNAVHRIRAGEILFNRTRNVLTASGGVEYVREEGSTVETFRGESITVNLDNWASIFIDGVSERTMAEAATAYRFAGTIISRDAEGATLLRNAEITNPASEEAFWSITASKLWLLPGNDFAILNAILRVGNIPLFYIPFFYFPADQVVFRPVIGFRTREGTFLQTTTYILGRPRTEVLTESSISMIFGGAGEDMETRREGIFLRTTGERRQDPGDVRLSVLFDTYVNLGFYLGTELTLPRRGPFGELSISAGLGVTRNIYPFGTTNTPFPNFDGESNWNRSRLFFLDVPFRYRFRMTGSYQIRYGSLSWDIPFYSDPYVDRDFMRRPQPRDWFSMLREFAEGEADHDIGADTFLSSYTWSLSGSFHFPVTAIRPFVNTLSISNISSTLLFGLRNSTRYTSVEGRSNPAFPNPLTPPNPGRAFFFPQRFTMYNMTVAIAGNPVSFGAAPPRALTPLPLQEPPGFALLPDIPISPWETPDEEAAEAELPDEHRLSPPVLAQTFHLRTAGGPRLTIAYRFTPVTAAEMHFRSAPSRWVEQEDIDWSEISRIESRVTGTGNLDFNLTHAGGGAYSAEFRITGSGSWHSYMYLNEESEEFLFASGPYAGQTNPDLVQAARDRASTATQLSSFWDFSSSIRPFFHNAVWSNTSLQHSVRGLLARNRVDTATQDRSWEMGSWDRDNITAHQISANIVASIMDRNQNITVSAMLPPRDATASVNATFRKWISETSIRGSVREPWDSELRTFDPIHITETLTFTPRINFQQHIVFNVENDQLTTLTSRFNLASFNASFSVLYARPWQFNPLFFDPAAGNQTLWTQNDAYGQPLSNRLAPQELRFGYAWSFSRDNLWGRRLSFSVNLNTNMAFDLQRYTNSRLNFNFSFTTRITNFLDLSFSTVSENVVMFRYFQNLPFFSSTPDDIFPGQETNILVDLLNSFRFDNRELRERSGFNLRSMNVSLLHHLGDWNARLTIHSTPLIDTVTRQYRFNNEISFMIQWVPIAEIRTHIEYTDRRLTIR